MPRGNWRQCHGYFLIAFPCGGDVLSEDKSSNLAEPSPQGLAHLYP